MSWLKRHLLKKRWQRACLYLASLLLILLAADIILAACWRRIEIGPETTYITSPLNAAGFPDYIAALNDEYGRGVTPENNAMPLLLQVMGTQDLPERAGKYSLPLIGLPPDPTPPLQLSLNQWCYKNSIPAPSETGTHLVSGALPSRSDQPSNAVSTTQTAPPPPAFAKPPHANPGEIVTLSGPTNPNSDQEILLAIEEKLRTKPWTRAENSLAARWIATQSETFRLAYAATSRPRCFLPLAADTTNPQTMPADLTVLVVDQAIPCLNHERLLADLLATDAMRCIGEHDPVGFQRDALAIMKLARLVAQGPSYIENLVAVAIDALASRTIQTAATRPDFFTAGQAQYLLGTMNTLGPLPSAAHSKDTAERWFGLYFYCYTYKAHAGTMFIPVHYNAVLRSFNRYSDEIVACYRLPTYRQRKARFGTLQTEIASEKPSVLGALINPAALWMAPQFPSLEHGAALSETADTNHSLARVALALKIFKNEHGNYPDSLAALAPAILPEIPQDTFIDAPLKYRRQDAGYLLYSVGPNEKDEGGFEQIGDKKKGDLVVRAAD